MTLSKMLLIAVGAALVLGALVGAASAGRLSSTSTTFRAPFSRVVLSGAFGTIDCIVTLEGSLHTRTITKTVGRLIGYVTAANLGPCASGSATFLRETLPWHLTYRSFAGTLPNITAMNVDMSGYSLQYREPLFTCLFRSGTGAAAMVLTFNREAGGALTTAIISGEAVPSSCGINARFTSSQAPLTVAGAATRITVTLI